MMPSYLCTIVHVWLGLVQRQRVGKPNIATSHAACDVSCTCGPHVP